MVAAAVCEVVGVTPVESDADADAVIDADGVCDAVSDDVAVFEGVSEAVGVTEGRCEAKLHDAFMGGSTTPRNTVLAGATASEIAAYVAVLYEYSVVEVTAYSTVTPASARPVME